MRKIPNPIKWHGGKYYLASRIVAMMPPHLHYVEPYAGGLSVLLAKDFEGISEVANDLDGRLTNFWRVLAEPCSFAVFERRAEGLPFCEAIFREAHAKLEKPCESPDEICINCALAFFIVARQSLAGRMDCFAPLSRRRVRRGMNEQASAWISAIEGLPAVHARLQRVVILNHDALDVIKGQDGVDTLFYLDPPYYPTTRGNDAYAVEMSVVDHQSLLARLSTIKGKFLLSGYNNNSYEGAARAWGWKRVDFDLPNNAACGDEKRRMVECLWTNF